MTDTIKFIISEGALLPSYQSKGASGFDVAAYSIIKAYTPNSKADELFIKECNRRLEKDKFEILPNERYLISTGLTLADCPANLELQLRLRSSIGLKKGLIMPNGIGTIDSDYRGEIGVILYNPTNVPVTIKKGERIAQIVPCEVKQYIIEQAHEVTNTERGSGGFGSTGQ